MPSWLFVISLSSAETATSNLTHLKHSTAPVELPLPRFFSSMARRTGFLRQRLDPFVAGAVPIRHLLPSLANELVTFDLLVYISLPYLKGQPCFEQVTVLIVSLFSTCATISFSYRCPCLMSGTRAIGNWFHHPFARLGFET